MNLHKCSNHISLHNRSMVVHKYLPHISIHLPLEDSTQHWEPKLLKERDHSPTTAVALILKSRYSLSLENWQLKTCNFNVKSSTLDKKILFSLVIIHLYFLCRFSHHVVSLLTSILDKLSTSVSREDWQKAHLVNYIDSNEPLVSGITIVT